METYVCDFCGKKFKRNRSRATDQGQRHHLCSQICRDLWHSLFPPMMCSYSDRAAGGRKNLGRRRPRIQNKRAD